MLEGKASGATFVLEGIKTLVSAVFVNALSAITAAWRGQCYTAHPSRSDFRDVRDRTVPGSGGGGGDSVSQEEEGAVDVDAQ